jgi:predicted DCC family thiol-disulfide oxidoreductase YuxK
MLEIGRTRYLLFDGDCGICTQLAGRAGRIDRRHLFTIVPYRRFSEEELVAVGLSYADCDRAAQVITLSGRVRSGAFAVNGFLIHFLPWSILIALIYLLFPVLLPLELIVYRLVAINRHTISGKLGMKECKVGD